MISPVIKKLIKIIFALPEPELLRPEEIHPYTPILSWMLIKLAK